MQTYRIGAFSKLGKVTVKTLRYYDEVGVLKPSFVDDENGYRYYTADQLTLVCRILFYKEMGFSIDEIRFLISSCSRAQLKQRVTTKQAQVRAGIEQAQQRLAMITRFLTLIEEGTAMNDVTIKALPEVMAATCRMVIPTYESLFEEAPAMGEKMKAHGAVCQEPAYCFNIYHDDEYKETDIDLEICEAVVAARENRDGIVYKIIPGVHTAACLFHQGPYDALGSSYAILFKWLEDNNFEIIDNGRESYIDGIWNKDDPADWLTEIQLPVKKK